MVDRLSMREQFQRRVAAVPPLGLGLSVDVYSPDLFDLMTRFQSQVSQPAYLEIFSATGTALRAVRQSLPGMPLAYHGEGLWITQPDFSTSPCLDEALAGVASQMHILTSPWLNHECATKQMGGYSFGTYLPPLYTRESAEIVAANVDLVQERLDHHRRPNDEFGPLFLLEMPPLTYFMVGTISVPRYFRLVTERTPCGLVLDIGHLWTVYRYSAAERPASLEKFIDHFLDEFPMERVVEIHIAGLAMHEADTSWQEAHPPWIDAHAAPIPSVSWGILDRVLSHPRLWNLRGVALEVDTKPAQLIVEEFGQALTRIGPTVAHLMKTQTPTREAVCDPLEVPGRTHASDDGSDLEADYVRYAQIASGQHPPAGPQWQAVIADPSGLVRYTHVYLPHEILHWGGKIADMFPETCERLAEQGVSLHEFVPWWFHKSRPADRPYDFFLLKIDRLVEFVAERAPMLLDHARGEAEKLRAAYQEACAGDRVLVEPCQ
ncbi:MAG TPA: DUF692 family protein [Nitrospira sp.]|nr:DUF692 family protein [Nitrospira sp.]